MLHEWFFIDCFMGNRLSASAFLYGNLQLFFRMTLSMTSAACSQQSKQFSSVS